MSMNVNLHLHPGEKIETSHQIITVSGRMVLSVRIRIGGQDITLFLGDDLQAVDNLAFGFEAAGMDFRNEITKES